MIGRGYNQVEMLKDATAHAEMLALSSAQEYVGDWRLNECDLYVTKEPCAMCAGGIIHCRIRSVIFGCSSPKDGAAGGGYINLLNQPTLNHRSEIRSGVLADYSSQLLKEFFQSARSNSKRKINNLEASNFLEKLDINDKLFCENSYNSFYFFVIALL